MLRMAFDPMPQAYYMEDCKCNSKILRNDLYGFPIVISLLREMSCVQTLLKEKFRFDFKQVQT